MAIKNQAKRKQAASAEVGKRFSKAKMKRDMVSENTVDNKNERVIKVGTNPRPHTCTAVEKYQFKGTPKRTFSATLRHHSSPQKGYKVLSEGQQVTVEDFGSDQPLRITAMDGRVGITQPDNIKPLFS